MQTKQKFKHEPNCTSGMPVDERRACLTLPGKVRRCVAMLWSVCLCVCVLVSPSQPLQYHSTPNIFTQHCTRHATKPCPCVHKENMAYRTFMHAIAFECLTFLHVFG